MSDRKTMGSDPIGEMLEEENGGAEPDDHGGEQQENRETSTEKTRVTVAIPEELAERLRNCVFWTAGDVTMAAVAEQGIKAAVKQVEQDRNDGEPFPDRERDLKGGRPVK